MLSQYKNGQNYLVSGQTFNEIAEAVNFTKGQMRTGEGHGKVMPFENGEVRIRAVDSDIPVFSAVVLTDLIFHPNGNDYVYQTQSFKGVFPAADYDGGPFAILAEPTKKGEIGRAVLIGVIPAQVKINDADVEYAEPVPGGEGEMQTADTGTARIVWKGGSSGKQWCILQLGSGSGGDTYDGPFAFKYDRENDKIVVKAGFVLLNGQWHTVAESEVEPSSGYLCVYSELDDNGQWSEPVLEIGEPGQFRYPVGKVEISGSGETRSVKCKQFRVPVAIIMDVAECPISVNGQ